MPCKIFGCRFEKGETARISPGTAGALPEKRCMRVGVACKISQIILAVCAGKCYNGTRVNLHLAGKSSCGV